MRLTHKTFWEITRISAPLVPVTVVFLVGILVGTYARLPPVSLIVVGAVSACVALWRLQNPGTAADC